ncbi:MAG: metallophosphoesterase [Phycisphaerae bacterium]
MPLELSRREWLKTTGSIALAGMLGSAAANAQDAPAARPARRNRALRLAHLTDIHVQPERRADQGMIACIKHMMSLKDRPEVVLTGGDLVMDSFDATFDRTKTQWDIFTRVLKDECGVPIEHCLGNHDIWGWNKSKSGATGEEPQYGKKWALELLGLAKPYRSFDRAGWHFIVLDSVAPGPKGGYIGKLDDEQMEWLKADLAKTPEKTPTLVLSHIPILAACAYFDTQREEETSGEWHVTPAEMHIDCRKLVELFGKHPNVKLCLSGHIHQIDRVEFNGVTYICDGAVCGAWWRGKNQGFPEGYGVLDLFDDGTFTHDYMTYGWIAAS